MRLAKDLALVWRRLLGDRKAFGYVWPFLRLFYSPPCLFCGSRTLYREREEVSFEVCDWQLFGPNATYSLCAMCALNHQVDVKAGMTRVQP